LCLFCNIKKFKTPAKLFENNWNKHVVIVYNGVVYDVRAYTVNIFFLSLHMNQVPEMLY
jgi:hypothetical protein